MSSRVGRERRARMEGAQRRSEANGDFCCSHGQAVGRGDRSWNGGRPAGLMVRTVVVVVLVVEAKRVRENERIPRLVG